MVRGIQLGAEIPNEDVLLDLEAHPHPSLDRLTRHHTVLSRRRPVEAVDAGEQQQTDYEKAQTAADWLEGISARLGTSDVGDIVTALRKPHTTSLSRPSSIVPPEGC